MYHSKQKKFLGAPLSLHDRLSVPTNEIVHFVFDSNFVLFTLKKTLRGCFFFLGLG